MSDQPGEEKITDSAVFFKRLADHLRFVRQDPCLIRKTLDFYARTIIDCHIKNENERYWDRNNMPPMNFVPAEIFKRIDENHAGAWAVVSFSFRSDNRQQAIDDIKTVLELAEDVQEDLGFVFYLKQARLWPELTFVF